MKKDTKKTLVYSFHPGILGRMNAEFLRYKNRYGHEPSRILLPQDVYKEYVEFLGGLNKDVTYKGIPVLALLEGE